MAQKVLSEASHTCRAYANGELFQDTKKRGKPIVFILGSRPLTGGLCRGVEEALKSMRAGVQSCVVLTWLSDGRGMPSGQAASCMAVSQMKVCHGGQDGCMAT